MNFRFAHFSLNNHQFCNAVKLSKTLLQSNFQKHYCRYTEATQQ